VFLSTAVDDVAGYMLHVQMVLTFHHSIADSLASEMYNNIHLREICNRFIFIATAGDGRSASWLALFYNTCMV
jgi:hypothetical protein